MVVVLPLLLLLLAVLQAYSTATRKGVLAANA
jgi:hypothetical protein